MARASRVGVEVNAILRACHQGVFGCAEQRHNGTGYDGNRGAQAKLTMIRIIETFIESEKATQVAPEQTMAANTTGFNVHDLLRFYSALVAGILLLLGTGLLIFSLLLKATFISGVSMIIVGALFGLLSKHLHHSEWD